MQTITLERPGHFVLSGAATPSAPAAKPAPGEAVVRVRRVGICGTDLHAYRGEQPFFTYPRILGHELAVEVVALGQGESNLRVGDRCAVEPLLYCGQCPPCRAGRANCCTSLRILGVHADGGMREFLTLPVHNLVPSAKLSFDQLALVEMLGIGCHAVGRGTVRAGETVLVTGVGPIGLSVVQFALLAGAKVIVLEINPLRLEFCRRHFPVQAAILRGPDALDAVKAAGGGELPSVVFDATGDAASMDAAFSFVAHGGRLVMVGLIPGKISFSDPDFHRRELTIFATRNATVPDFHRTQALVEEGKVDALPWITHRATPDTLATEFPKWLDPNSGRLKAMLEM